jgi:hypothetical protein
MPRGSGGKLQFCAVGRGDWELIEGHIGRCWVKRIFIATYNIQYIRGKDLTLVMNE